MKFSGKWMERENVIMNVVTKSQKNTHETNLKFSQKVIGCSHNISTTIVLLRAYYSSQATHWIHSDFSPIVLTTPFSTRSGSQLG